MSVPLSGPTPYLRIWAQTSTGPRSVPGCLRTARKQTAPHSHTAVGLNGLPQGASPTRLLPPLGPRWGGDGGRRTEEGQHQEGGDTIKRITNLYPRDIRALSALARCGYVTEEHLKQAGLRDKRIDSYQKDGLVERAIYSHPGSRETDRAVYCLTAAGRDLCRRELCMTGLYNAQNPAHDLAIAERYFSLPQEERETWKTESQCRDIFEEHLRQLRNQGEEERAQELWDKLQDGLLSMPDAIYQPQGGPAICFEVVTNSYGQEEIQAKEDTAEALGMDIEFTKA